MFVVRVYLAGLPSSPDAVAAMCHACNKRNFVPIVPNGSAEENLSFIDHADVLLANLDTANGGINERTAFEMGYAKARGVPVYGVSVVNLPINFMISFCSKIINGTFEDALDRVKGHFNAI